MVDKIKYYLSHDLERNSIKENGYKMIHEGDYSWKELVKDILSKIKA